MWTFMLQRFAEAILVVFMSTVLIFLGLRLIPGDPALVLAGQNADPAAVAAIRQANGLDQPLVAQYLIWLGNVLRGDLGVSFFSRAPISQLLAQRAPASLELAVAAMALSILVALPTGILAAIRQHRPSDWVISAFNGFAIAVPGFWLGIL